MKDAEDFGGERREMPGFTAISRAYSVLVSLPVRLPHKCKLALDMS